MAAHRSCDGPFVVLGGVVAVASVSVVLLKFVLVVLRLLLP